MVIHVLTAAWDLHFRLVLSALLKYLELWIRAFVHMEMLPVLRCITAKRVVKVLPVGKIALHLEILLATHSSVLFI